MSLQRGGYLGLIVALLMLATAAAFAVRAGILLGRDDTPATPESATYWYCDHCRRGFTLTAREYADQVFFVSMPADAAGRASRGRPAVKCPTCGEAAVSARRCLTDGEIFDPHGRIQVCPKCGWDPLAR